MTPALEAHSYNPWTTRVVLRGPFSPLRLVMITEEPNSPLAKEDHGVRKQEGNLIRTKCGDLTVNFLKMFLEQPIFLNSLNGIGTYYKETEKHKTQYRASV